jgi:ABC-type antimicrobial peptide transport system permease subunit
VVPRRQAVATARAADGPGDAPLRVSLVAAPPDYLATLSIPVETGRWLRAGDADGREGEGVCTLDAAAAGLLFPDADPEQVLGRLLEIEAGGRKRTHRVIGILSDPLRYRALFEAFDEGRGSRTLTSTLLSFRNVYVPASALDTEDYSGISIVLPSDEAVAEARRRLLRIWALDAADPAALMTGGVGVFVRRDWMDALGSSTRQGTMLGNIIWIIVVLVAAVMISTLNLITIRERYDEIALRRCEGARRRDVALQVTVEGTAVAVAGGLLGLPIGYAGAALLRRIVDFPFRFEMKYALAATGIAILLGLIASVLPARHAARLQPARVLGRRLR